jgi:putative transposase
VIFSAVYLPVRSLPGCLMVVARGEVSKDPELLMLRHENAVLRRAVKRRLARPESACLGWRALREVRH